MKTNTLTGEELSLSSGKLSKHRLRTNGDGYVLEALAEKVVGEIASQEQLPKWYAASPDAGATLFWRTISGGNGPGRPGLFFQLNHPRALWRVSDYPGRMPMNNEKDTDDFHDSGSEDIYDLYNACNGIVRNGLLDVNQLDEFDPDDARALNVPRLREIWDHTRSGCRQCEQIIEALHILRTTVREVARDIASPGPAIDMEDIG